MIELVFVACLIASPESCEERTLSFLSQSGPMACMIQAPPTLAAWTAEHPGLKVTSWRCEDPEHRAAHA